MAAIFTIDNIRYTVTADLCVQAFVERNKLSFVDGAVLEIKGTNGILRIDLSEGELQKVLFQRKVIQRIKEDQKRITCGPGEI